MFTMSLGKHVRILFSGSFVKIKKRDDFLDVLDTLVMVSTTQAYTEDFEKVFWLRERTRGS